MKNQKGITLIALVITIIVMLILVGVTISVSLNGGLFTTAKQATNETQVEQEKEELLIAAMGALGEDGKVDLEKLDSNLPEGFQTTGETGIYKSSTGNAFTVSENGSITLEGKSSEETPEDSDGIYVNGHKITTIVVEPENSGTVTYEIDGSKIKFTGIGNDSYVFRGWTIGGNYEINSGTTEDNIIEITPQGDLEIYATFYLEE